MPETILVYSGGLDSTVLLYDLLSQGVNTKAISFHYGQRHEKEIGIAAHITNNLNIEHRIVDLSNLSIFFEKSALINHSAMIPQGAYTEHNLKNTVVPNRNMIFIAIASAWAIQEKISTVSYAAHNGDTPLYPDCRESFAQALNQALQLADWQPISLLRPYISLKKHEIISIGHKLNVPLEKTWSCYHGKTLHCGQCSTCIDRKNAFKQSSVEDLTSYYI